MPPAALTHLYTCPTLDLLPSICDLAPFSLSTTHAANNELARAKETLASMMANPPSGLEDRAHLSALTLRMMLLPDNPLHLPPMILPTLTYIYATYKEHKHVPPLRPSR